MAEIVAYIEASGVPLTGPAGADIPEVVIVRTPANTVAQVSVDMVELTNAPGWYQFTFATVDGEEYVWIVDGDPVGGNGLAATERYKRGAISGTTVERSEVDVPAILADTDSLDTTKITAPRAANLDEITAARLAELDAANLPADIDTLLARLTAARALLLDNLDATVSSRSSHSAADVDTTLSGSHGAGAWDATATVPPQTIRDAMKLAPTAGAPAAGSVDEHLDAVVSRVDGELVDVATFLGTVLGTPAVHTPTTISAGGQSYTVGVVGSTVTITRIT